MRYLAPLLVLLASLATAQPPGYGYGGAGGGDVDETSDLDWTGLHTWEAGEASFGGAVGATGACWFDTDSLICEGTDDDFELTITFTDPVVDTVFTIGHSPDGNPWIGAGAGGSCGAACVDDVFIGHSAGGAANGTSTDNTCVGDLACDSLTTGDANIVIGADADVQSAGSSNVLAIGVGASGYADSIAIGNYANLDASSAGVGIGRIATARGTGGIAIGYAAETADGVSIGYLVGDATAAADLDNVFVGNSAGTAANGTSTDNACAGDLCLDTLTTGDRNAALGANTDVGTNTDSDWTGLGEGIVGRGSDTMSLGFGGVEAIFANGAGLAITDNTTTNVFTATVVTGSYCAVQLMYHYATFNATDSQMHTAVVAFGATANADDGVLTHDASEETEHPVLSTGSLADTWDTASGGANSVTLRAKFDSSLDTDGTLFYNVLLTSGCTITYH